MQKIQHPREIFLLCLACMIFMGCERDSSESLNKIVNRTLEVSDSALQHVSNLDPEDAKKEFKKLNQYEYQVVSFKKDILASDLEGRLSVYGAQGFDCSEPILREQEMLMICKRRPESYLRYIPQGIMGKP